MALTQSDINLLHMLVEHYGYVDDWKIDHWKNLNLLIEAGLDEYKAVKGAEAKELKKPDYEEKPEKLFSIAKKMQHVEGLNEDEKLFVTKELLSNAKSLWDEDLKLLKERSNNPEAFIEKRPVGRPSKKVPYRWLDYLVIELGSINKAVNYACDFPITEPRNPDSLRREYRKYRKAKGEG
jgi:oligoribonuclease NrnB/cAMP/cGMP phosphodiesterase (DHH superfamily)